MTSSKRMARLASLTADTTALTELNVRAESGALSTSQSNPALAKEQSSHCLDLCNEIPTHHYRQSDAFLLSRRRRSRSFVRREESNTSSRELEHYNLASNLYPRAISFEQSRHPLLAKTKSPLAEKYVPPFDLLPCLTTDPIKASQHPHVLHKPSKSHQKRKWGQEAGHSSPQGRDDPPSKRMRSVISRYDGAWSDLRRRSHIVLGDIRESMYPRECNIFYHIVLYFIFSVTLRNVVLKLRVDFSSVNINGKHRSW